MNTCYVCCVACRDLSVFEPQILRIDAYADTLGLARSKSNRHFEMEVAAGLEPLRLVLQTSASATLGRRAGN
jgi:hypothetical protein